MRWGTVIFAVVTLAAPPVNAVEPDDRAAELVVVGRVVSVSTQPIEAAANTTTLDSLYTYKVSVTKVVLGADPRPVLTVRAVSDPPIRSDRSFVFKLKRFSDGTYTIIGLDQLRHR